MGDLVSDVFYLRPLDQPIVPRDLAAMASHAEGCFGLHRVEWRRSFLSKDGRRMLCWYHAPDAESARLALRQLGSDMNAVWAGVVFGAPTSGAPVSGNLVAEFSFTQPQGVAAIAARVGDTSVLDRHGLALVHGFLSASGTHMACVYSGEQSALLTLLDGLGLPAEVVWECSSVSPFSEIPKVNQQVGRQVSDSG